MPSTSEMFFLANQIWSRFGSTKQWDVNRYAELKQFSQDLTPKQMLLSGPFRTPCGRRHNFHQLQSSWWDHGWRNLTPVGICIWNKAGRLSMLTQLLTHTIHIYIWYICPYILVVFLWQMVGKDTIGWYGLTEWPEFIHQQLYVDWFWDARSSERYRARSSIRSQPQNPENSITLRLCWRTRGKQQGSRKNQHAVCCIRVMCKQQYIYIYIDARHVCDMYDKTYKLYICCSPICIGSFESG